MSFPMRLTVLLADSPIPPKAFAMTNPAELPITKLVIQTHAGNTQIWSMPGALPASGDAQVMWTLTVKNAAPAVVIPMTATSTIIL